MTTAIATATSAPQRSLVTKFAEKFSIEPNRLLTTLKATAFRQKEGRDISNEQMAALLVVADQYDLNPFTKEIYAFEDKGAIVPIVSVDGWARIINSHPQLDGVEFAYSETVVTPDGGKPCPEWCEVIIYRKDRARPIVVREYLDEVYRPPGKRRDGSTYDSPWQTHTKRFLRHKALIQGSRIAFGFAGIYDQDEGERIIEGQAVRVTATNQDVADFAARLQHRAESAEPVDVHVVEVDAELAEQVQQDATDLDGAA